MLDDAMKIGNIPLTIPFVQAALAGYTEYPMRKLSQRFGCPLTFTGVMLDRIALHPKAMRQPKFHPHDDEHPVAAQILGDEPRTLAEAAAVFERLGYDMIDLNFACPVPKVLRRQRGGFLMQKPAVVREALRQTRQAVSCPVAMKIRIGFDRSAAAEEDFWAICAAAAEEGVDMLAIHGRTVDQKYRGKADWSRIAEVKRRLPNLTVFGSGDIFSADTAFERLTQTGIDGVVVARGAIGNPWIFSELRARWQGQADVPEPSLAEQGQVMLEHFEMLTQSRAGTQAVSFFRKFVPGYAKRHPERKKVMLALLAARSPEQLYAIIRAYYGV
jgi:nifR3 family TIM-barrel protein